MARTAIVNPRKRKPAKRKAKKRTYGRRRNPSTGGDRSYNARRRRPARRRRRNPTSAPARSVYSTGGYRQRNPSDLFDFDYLMDKMPAATAGVWLGRYAVKMAGPFEQIEAGAAGGAGKMGPGLKHAFALLVASRFGSQMVGSALGNDKAQIAEIACLGFAGDLFARKRLFEDSTWVQDNLYLSGVDDMDFEGDDDDVSGFEQDSALGELIVGDDGTVYQLNGVAPDPANYPGGIAGFEQNSALGFAPVRPSADSGFGYA